MWKCILPLGVCIWLTAGLSAAEANETMPWSPAAFGQGLTLWIDGQDVDGDFTPDTADEAESRKVAEWRDKSPLRQRLVQPDVEKQPTARAGLGGRQTVHFGDGGLISLLEGESVSLGMGANEMTYVAVVRCAEEGSDIVRPWLTIGPPRSLIASFLPRGGDNEAPPGALAFGIQHRQGFATREPHINRPVLMVAQNRHVKEGNLTGYVNGQLADAGDDPFFNPGKIPNAKIAPVMIGSDNPRFLFQGEVAEIVVCRFLLDDDQRRQLEGYLAHKWGLTGQLPDDHPYKMNPPGPVVVPGAGTASETKRAGDMDKLPPYQPVIQRAPEGRGYPRWPDAAPAWTGEGPEPWSLEWYEQVAWKFGSWHQSFHPTHRHMDWITYDPAWARKYFPLPEWKPDFTGVDFNRVSPQTDPPGVHPRIYFSPSDIPAIMERIQGSRWGRHYWESLKLQTDDFFQETYEHKGETHKSRVQAFVDGTATYEDRSYDISSQMMINALRAVLEGDRVRGERVGKMLHHWANLHWRKMDEGGWNILGPYRIWHGFCVSYDLAYPFLTEDQRRDVRKVIARAITKPSPYIDLVYGVNVPRPSHNWMSLVTMPILVGYLAIEGEEGYDPFYTWKMAEAVERWLTFWWSAEGVSYESMGKNQANLHYLIPLARRGNWLVTHPHIRKAVDNFYLYALQPWGKYMLTTGSFASSESMLRQPDCMVTKYLLPDDPRVDFVYRNAMGTPPEQPAGRKGGSFPGAGEATLGMEHILFASDWEGMDDPEPLVDGFAKLGLNPDFFDPEQALYVARSDWSKDAIQVRMSSEQQSTAKLKPDAAAIYLSALGRVWGKQSGDRKSSGYSTITVDGAEHPYPYARILSHHSEDDFSFAVNDWSPACNGYVKGAEERSPVDNDFRVLKPTSYPGGDIDHNIIWNRPWLRLDTENPYSLFYWKNGRELHLQAHRHQYGIESIPVLDTALRTLMTVRGRQPYLLVRDQVRPVGGGNHSYIWRFTLEDGIEWDENSPRGEIRLRDAETDRRLLFRLLHGPADAKVEVARFKNDFSGGEERQLQIRSEGAGLDMALLIMPYMEQDELPRTAFDPATGKIEIAFAGQRDLFTPVPRTEPIGYADYTLERSSSDSRPALVTFAAGPEPLKADGSNTGLFTLKREGDTARPLRVHLEWSGTFRPENLAAPLPGEVEFKAGQRELSIPIRASGKVRRAFARTIVLRVNSGGGYAVSGPSATLRILADPPSPAEWTPRVLGESLTLWLDAHDLDGDGEGDGLAEGGLHHEAMDYVRHDRRPLAGVWRDKSGRGNHLGQPNPSLAPELAVGSLNGRDTLWFGRHGRHAFLSNPGAQLGDLANGFTYVAVLRPHSSDHVRMEWMKATIDGGVVTRGPEAGQVHVWRPRRESLGTQDSFFDRPLILSATHDLGRAKALGGHVNGRLLEGGMDPNFTQAPNLAGTAQGFLAGAENGRFMFVGDMAEILVVNRHLSESERIKLEGYLAHKWGLAPELAKGHPHRDQAP